MNRAERRRQLKDDQRAIARGLDTQAPEAAQVMVLMRVMYALIEEARSAASIAPLMAFLQENVRAAGRVAPLQAIACRRGCAHCCHAWVSARAPEVLFVNRAIAPREREAIRAAVAATHRTTGGLGPEERARIAAPCPLLQSNQCKAYAARPITCRTAVSSDALACARAFQPGAPDEPILMPDFYILLKRGYSVALAGALKRAGFPATSYEFTAALQAVLARPDAEAAWLAGEDVFADVARDPGSDPFDHASNRRLYDAAWAGWS